MFCGAGAGHRHQTHHTVNTTKRLLSGYRRSASSFPSSSSLSLSTSPSYRDLVSPVFQHRPAGYASARLVPTSNLFQSRGAVQIPPTFHHPSLLPGKNQHSRAFSSTPITMTATKIDGTAIAKSIRDKLHTQIEETQKTNPRFRPSLKIIQGMALPHGIGSGKC